MAKKYNVKEKGSDFLGNKKYEVTEKPSNGNSPIELILIGLVLVLITSASGILAFIIYRMGKVFGWNKNRTAFWATVLSIIFFLCYYNLYYNLSENGLEPIIGAGIVGIFAYVMILIDLEKE